MGEMSVGRFENKQLEIERVTLWTRQHMSSLNQLKKNGVYRAKKEYIEEYFEDIASYYLMLYSWFTEQASRIVPKPAGVQFPIWCSVSEEYMLRRSEEHV